MLIASILFLAATLAYIVHERLDMARFNVQALGVQVDKGNSQ